MKIRLGVMELFLLLLLGCQAARRSTVDEIAVGGSRLLGKSGAVLLALGYLRRLARVLVVALLDLRSSAFNGFLTVALHCVHLVQAVDRRREGCLVKFMYSNREIYGLLYWFFWYIY